VFLGWLAGVLILLAVFVQRVYFVRGLIAQGKPANGQIVEVLKECRSQIGIHRNVELRLTGNTISPAVCGLFKPVILMPATLLEKLSREKLKAVLIHELAHIKRADIWMNLLQTVLQIVYFYNPLVWIANAMVRRVREQAVDEMVLVALGPETKSYSNVLIDIAEMVFCKPGFGLRLVGVVESKKALERRIKHMLNRDVPKSSKLGILGLFAIVVIGVIILPMASGAADEEELPSYVPSTSTVNEQGHIVDKIDYPFVNDPQVIGTWEAIDFVGEMEDFKVGEKQWKGRGGNYFYME
jgi:bla regulator protein BlaR1